MAPMVKRVPDEYFRQRATDARGTGEEEATPPEVESPAVKAVAPEAIRDGWAPRYVVLVLVLALAASFIVGRVLIFPALSLIHI